MTRSCGQLSTKRETKRAVERVYGVRNVTAEWRYQRDEAEFVAANILGVIDIENDVDILSPRPDAGEIHHSITKALERDATLDVDNIAVSSSHGRVTLTGSVRSWSEHDTVVVAAWSAPGVITVDDRLRVNY